jgi:hypothetical protein
MRVGKWLINLWLYKENDKLWDLKDVFTVYIPPSAPYTLMTLLFSFFNPCKKNYFGCVANHLSAVNVASSVIKNFLALRRFLRLGKR